MSNLRQRQDVLEAPVGAAANKVSGPAAWLTLLAVAWAHRVLGLPDAVAPQTLAGSIASRLHGLLCARRATPVGREDTHGASAACILVCPASSLRVLEQQAERVSDFYNLLGLQELPACQAE